MVARKAPIAVDDEAVAPAAQLVKAHQRPERGDPIVLAGEDANGDLAAGFGLDRTGVEDAAREDARPDRVQRPVAGDKLGRAISGTRGHHDFGCAMTRRTTTRLAGVCRA